MRQSSLNPRQLAFIALKAVDQGAYADVALNRVMVPALKEADRRLLTELVYGGVRRSRTLDALIDQFAKQPAQQQPPDLRTVLHLGFYQLRYLHHIPAAAAIHTSVELAKQNRLSGLAGVVNAVLRQYTRATTTDPLVLPADPQQRLGIEHSYPDWIIQVWADQLGIEATAQLCEYGNQSPHLDLRINPLRTDRATVQAALAAWGVTTHLLGDLPQGLRVVGNTGPIPQLPGFREGWWTVQEASAQWVGHVLNPQPGAVVVDVCAAPGGKTTHLAELMLGQGELWACDRTPSRLRKLHQNLQRLGLDHVQVWTGDSRQLSDPIPMADYLLVDAPCSGLGTLHRHADARWRQTPQKVTDLAQLQSELLAAAAQRVKPGGQLLYATCTLHPAENEAVVERFLQDFPNWEPLPIVMDCKQTQGAQADPGLTETISRDLMPTDIPEPAIGLKIWPHERDMDGFFLAHLRRLT